MPSARALVVSLHDVSPRTFAESRRIVAELTTLGVPRISLLVIPDHHHRGRVSENAELCAWLRELESDGHEIVLHGLYHQRARRSGETVRQKLTTRFYTAGEGEFYDLDRDTARETITRGLAELRTAGVSPVGFIAPAWLLSAPAETALREQGLEYTTRLGSVTDLQVGPTQQPVHSQSLVWSVRSRWRRTVSLAWNAALFRRLDANPLLRISIHPVDVGHVAIWKQIRSLTTRALEDREPMTYYEWITQQRATRDPALNSSTA